MVTLLAHILLPLLTSYLLVSCLCSFVVFVSSQSNLQTQHHEHDTPVITLGVLDLCLVVLFILQHKIMASDRYKKFLLYSGIYVVERLIYVAVTSFTLMVVMAFWEPITSLFLWNIDTSNRFFLWLFFFLVHAVLWFVMLVDALHMDPLEMIGLQQIYNYHMNLGPPTEYLPRIIQRMYRGLRHPGPVCLVLILWLHPNMTLDRFILSYLFTWFLLSGFRVSKPQYRRISKWLTETREEVFEETYRVGYRRSGLDYADSGVEAESSD